MAKTIPLSRELIEEYKQHLLFAIERWDMDYEIANAQVKPNYMQRRAMKELNRIRAMRAAKSLVIAAAGAHTIILTSQKDSGVGNLWTCLCYLGEILSGEEVA